MTDKSTVSLAEVCEIVQGGRHKKSGNHFVNEGGFPAFGAGGLNGYLDFAEFEREAVILSSIGARCGKCFYTLGKWTSLANTQVILPDLGKIHPKFLWYQLNDENRWPRAGTGQPFIKPSDVKNHKIFAPPLAEQKRIAAILDKADAIRRKLQQSLRLSDDFLRSVFLDMFGDPVTNPMGWPIVKIGDLLDSTSYGTSKKASEATGAFPCLRMNNITYSGGWDFKSLKYVDLDSKEQKKNLVHRGQLLFNRTNSKELVGKTAVYRRKEPMAFAGYLVRGIANTLADAEYISAYLNLPHGKAVLQGMCKNIIGMANINAEEFKSILIQKPPVALQRQFAAIVHSTEQKKKALNKFLTESETLFSSLQQRAFRGEL